MRRFIVKLSATALIATGAVAALQGGASASPLMVPHFPAGAPAAASSSPSDPVLSLTTTMLSSAQEGGMRCSRRVRGGSRRVALHGVQGMARVAEDQAVRARHLVRQFVEERAWQPFHSPKNLAMGIAVEAAELMECFLWLDLPASYETAKDPVKREDAKDGLALAEAIVDYLYVFTATYDEFKKRRSSNASEAD